MDRWLCAPLVRVDLCPQVQLAFSRGWRDDRRSTCPESPSSSLGTSRLKIWKSYHTWSSLHSWKCHCASWYTRRTTAQNLGLFVSSSARKLSRKVCGTSHRACVCAHSSWWSYLPRGQPLAWNCWAACSPAWDSIGPVSGSVHCTSECWRTSACLGIRGFPCQI